MKKLLQNGRKQTVRNLNSLLREMKENTRFISENKNSQFANKNLVRLLTEYKKETNKYKNEWQYKGYWQNNKRNGNGILYNEF